MSTIYDNMGNGSEDKSALDEVFGRSANKYEEPVVIKNAGPEMPVQEVIETSPSDLREYRQQIDTAKNALNLEDDVVLIIMGLGITLADIWMAMFSYHIIMQQIQSWIS